MKKVNKIILHCSATKEGVDINAKTIDGWHKKRGWKEIGYHYVVRLDGLIETGRMINEIGAHVKGENLNSIGICYIGGLESFETNGEYKPKDTRTKEQKESILILLNYLKKIYPEALIYGHNSFSNKSCPCFNVNKEYKSLTKIKSNGIYNNKLARIINWVYGIYKNYNKPNSN